MFISAKEKLALENKILYLEGCQKIHTDVTEGLIAILKNHFNPMSLEFQSIESVRTTAEFQQSQLDFNFNIKKE